MEYTQWGSTCFRTCLNTCVLILVVMEYTQWEKQVIEQLVKNGAS